MLRRIAHRYVPGGSSVMLGTVLLSLTAAGALGDGYERGTTAADSSRDWMSDPFFKDSSFKWHLRTYYLGRDNFDGTTSQAWAGGGWLSYRSGLWRKTFYIGATAYTSQPIYAPEGEGGTLLLTNDQDAINTIGEAYVGAKFWGQDLVAGRQLLDTPLINRRDNRMIPLAFEGVTLRSDTSKDAKLEYIAGYFWTFKPRDQSNFQSISSGFSPDDTDNGTPFAWVRWRPTDRLSLGFEDYWVADTINTGYAEALYAFPKRKNEPQYRLDANIITQNTVGGSPLTGAPYFTYQASARFTADFGDLALIAIGSNTGEGAAINFPLGVKPNYTDMQQLSFDRAGEAAAGVGTTLKLDKLGFKDVTAAAWYVWGWNAIDAVTNESLPDRDELNLALRYQAKEGRWKGLSLWARYSDVFSHDAGVRDEQPEFRFIVDYTIDLRKP